MGESDLPVVPGWLHVGLERIHMEAVARDKFAQELGAIETALEDRVIALVLARLTDVVGRHRIAIADLVAQRKDPGLDLGKDVVFPVIESLNELFIVLLQLSSARSQFQSSSQRVRELCCDLVESRLKLEVVPRFGGNPCQSDDGLQRGE